MELITLSTASSAGIFWICALYTVSIVTAIWLLGLVLGDHSVMDGYYGFGYAIPVWIAFALSHAQSQTAAMLLLMASLHGCRLGLYLSIRWLGYRKTFGGDPRYLNFVKQLSPGYWWKSFFKVMEPQAILIVVLGLPAVWGVLATPAVPMQLMGWIGTAVGLIIFGVGYYFETAADAQLQAFKADAHNKGRYLQTGVWTNSRHPNYFGNTAVWWGIWLVAVAGNPALWWTVVAPIVNTIMLTKVLGSQFQDNYMGARPEYQALMRRTNRFLPYPPPKKQG